MNTHRIRTSYFLAAMLALAPSRLARADDSASQIAFSDPSKPGVLKIRVWHGEVSIHGADVKEISVKSESTPANPTPRKDGLRVLSSSAGFVLSEKGNVATLEYGADGWTGGSADFDITVPRSTSIVVANAARGDFECSGLSGDIDVRTVSGDVKLDDISGGALVETVNGEIDVNVKSLPASRPLSFTSMHGQITIHLPADSKANVRFRTHRGVILTNFDDKALVTKTEISRGRAHKEPKSEKLKASGDEQDGDTPPVPPVPPVPSTDSDGDWHADIRESVRDIAISAADAAREAADAMHEGLEEFHAGMSGNIPPLPPMTGGKVVSGTLNGGGVEIQAATLYGDIILKKVD